MVLLSSYFMTMIGIKAFYERYSYQGTASGRIVWKVMTITGWSLYVLARVLMITGAYSLGLLPVFIPLFIV